MPPIIWGRPADILAKSGWASGFCAGHCEPFGGGRLRVLAFGQPLRSPAAETWAPLVEPLEDTRVEEEDVDELEEMEEDELVRWMFLRVANMPRGSSELIELSDCPPLTPHCGRLRFDRLGGFATAVMENASGEAPTMEMGCVDGGRGYRVGAWSTERNSPVPSSGVSMTQRATRQTWLVRPTKILSYG